MSGQLGFDLPGLPPPVPVEVLSRAQRLTAHNRALLDAGRHPSGHRLLEQPDVERPLRCGDCDHHLVSRKGHVYHKCEVHRLGPSSSEQSDIRVSWPACVKFKESP